jgi:uncharacterized protein YndB with AHSA1/START domain
MNSPDVAAEDLEYEFELDEPLEKVWRALIDPKIAATWMLPDEEEPQTGALTCDLVSAEPPRRVSYRWQCDDEPASYVTFELARVPGGTRLRLTHAKTLEIRGPVAMLMAA